MDPSGHVPQVNNKVTSNHNTLSPQPSASTHAKTMQTHVLSNPTQTVPPNQTPIGYPNQTLMAAME